MVYSAVNENLSPIRVITSNERNVDQITSYSVQFRGGGRCSDVGKDLQLSMEPIASNKIVQANIHNAKAASSVIANDDIGIALTKNPRCIGVEPWKEYADNLDVFRLPDWKLRGRKANGKTLEADVILSYFPGDNTDIH